MIIICFMCAVYFVSNAQRTIASKQMETEYGSLYESTLSKTTNDYDDDDDNDDDHDDFFKCRNHSKNFNNNNRIVPNLKRMSA